MPSVPSLLPLYPELVPDPTAGELWILAGPTLPLVFTQSALPGLSLLTCERRKCLWLMGLFVLFLEAACHPPGGDAYKMWGPAEGTQEVTPPWRAWWPAGD